MGDELSIAAIVLLLGLVIYSVIKQRAGGAEARTEAELRTAGGEEQRERSLHRRAEARAAHEADR
jgi:hypothetical protein